jgi:hypothetical protein
MALGGWAADFLEKRFAEAFLGGFVAATQFFYAKPRPAGK